MQEWRRCQQAAATAAAARPPSQQDAPAEQASKQASRQAGKQASTLSASPAHVVLGCHRRVQPHHFRHHPAQLPRHVVGQLQGKGGARRHAAHINWQALQPPSTEPGWKKGWEGRRQRLKSEAGCSRAAGTRPQQRHVCGGGIAVAGVADEASQQQQQQQRFTSRPSCEGRVRSTLTTPSLSVV
jgi:hypothetical protein